MREALAQPVDDRYDLVAARHRQAAAGAEIVLHVDDDQHVLVAWDDRSGHGALLRWSANNTVKPRAAL
jgi:hypothetical protein